MISYGQLRAASSGSYDRAAEVWRQAAKVLRDQADNVASATKQLMSAWDGGAAEAAVTRLNGLVNRLDAANAALMSLDQTLSVHADGIRQAQAMLDNATEHATRSGVTVQPDGSVVSPSGIDTPSQGEAVATQAVAQGIEAALSYATNLDTQTQRALTALMPRVAETMTAPPIAGIPAPGTDPRAVAAWWSQLTPAEQRWLIENVPEQVGRLDGVPAVARDQANRILLDEARRSLQTRKADLESQLAALTNPSHWPTPVRNPVGAAYVEQQRLQAQLTEINGKLGGVDAIEKRLAQPGAGEDRAYLLLFDTNGNGRAVVATGNPDAAANVVTYVPGTGSGLAGIGHDMVRADRMADTANQFNPADHSVAVAWIGYDAPQTIPQATDIGYADHAQGDLSRFQDGLRVTHEGAASHNTVIGHSYGSTVVGVTAHSLGISADDVIFVGSPGVGVDHASDLHMATSHVWSGDLPSDPIPKVARLAGHPEQVVPHAPLQDDRLLFGTNPDGPNFGGQRFDTQAGTSIMTAHSEYWEPNSTSLKNIGRIVADLPGSVGMAPS